MKSAIKIIAFAFLYFSMTQYAAAQLSNKPFQFKNAPSGIGMSNGGKQAIINETLFGIRPDNIIRDSSGNLLSVEKTKGGSALVTYGGTDTVIPSYRGSDFSGSNQAMRVGVFNAFFTQDFGRSSLYSSAIPSFMQSTVNTWTGRVAADNPMGEHIYMGPGTDTVDAWTGQVLVLTSY